MQEYSYAIPECLMDGVRSNFEQVVWNKLKLDSGSEGELVIELDVWGCRSKV